MDDRQHSRARSETLGHALLVIPLSSVVMVVLSVGIQRMVARSRVVIASLTS
jgi:hypothetical protein